MGNTKERMNMKQYLLDELARQEYCLSLMEQYRIEEGIAYRKSLIEKIKNELNKYETHWN